MSSVLQEQPMAKPKGRPKTSERNDVTVKIDRGIANMAKKVAESRGVPVAQFLSDLLEGPVGKAYAARMRELEGKE